MYTAVPVELAKKSAATAWQNAAIAGMNINLDEAAIRLEWKRIVVSFQPFLFVAHK
jgi:hypothetical protein